MSAVTKIFGLHAAQAALDYTPEKLICAWVDKHRQDRRIARLLEDLSGLGIAVQSADRRELDRLSGGQNHQGVVIELSMPRELDEHDLKQTFEDSAPEALPFFLVLDHVQDPHNLGACLRTADAAGVHGVVTTKDQSAGLSPTVFKVASGAAETIPLYRVTNLARTLRWLKNQGVWVVGAAGDSAQTVYDVDLTVPVAIVIGAEGTGLRRLTREQCDLLAGLPMLGRVESLNLSVAAGILLYETVRQRRMRR
ncbi:MAG: 23S rRNA (guanosine(2251)-2'-O)-methyltransferase RlmB [Pseudomonadota bacterium]